MKIYVFIILLSSLLLAQGTQLRSTSRERARGIFSYIQTLFWGDSKRSDNNNATSISKSDTVINAQTEKAEAKSTQPIYFSPIEVPSIEKESINQVPAVVIDNQIHTVSAIEIPAEATKINSHEIIKASEDPSTAFSSEVNTEISQNQPDLKIPNTNVVASIENPMNAPSIIHIEKNEGTISTQKIINELPNIKLESPKNDISEPEIHKIVKEINKEEPSKFTSDIKPEVTVPQSSHESIKSIESKKEEKVESNNILPLQNEKPLISIIDKVETKITELSKPETEFAFAKVPEVNLPPQVVANEKIEKITQIKIDESKPETKIAEKVKITQPLNIPNDHLKIMKPTMEVKTPPKILENNISFHPSEAKVPVNVDNKNEVKVDFEKEHKIPVLRIENSLKIEKAPISKLSEKKVLNLAEDKTKSQKVVEETGNTSLHFILQK